MLYQRKIENTVLLWQNTQKLHIKHKNTEISLQFSSFHNGLNGTKENRNWINCRLDFVSFMKRHNNNHCAFSHIGVYIAYKRKKKKSLSHTRFILFCTVCVIFTCLLLVYSVDCCCCCSAADTIAIQKSTIHWLSYKTARYSHSNTTKFYNF